MENKESLERRLEIIKDLKRDNYVGTQEAHTYLKQMQSLENILQIIPRDINNYLERTLEPSKVYHRATPENILGLANILAGVTFEADYLEAKQDDENMEEEIFSENGLSPERKEPPIDYGGNWLRSFSHTARHLYSNYPKIIEFLKPVFQKAQLKVELPDGKTKKDFQNTVLTALAITAYNRGFQPLSEIRKSSTEDTFKKINFGYAFSKEISNGILDKIKIDTFQNNMDIWSKVNRMKRDQVDHRIENRREIATDVLQFCKNSYENSVNFAKYVIEVKEDQVRTIRELRKCMGEEYDVIGEEKKLIHIKDAQFVLHCLTSNEPFLRRYLEN